MCVDVGTICVLFHVLEREAPRTLSPLGRRARLEPWTA